MSESDIPSVVIDPGSSTLKAGFTGDDAPRVVIPAVVGRPKIKLEGVQIADHYVGDEAQTRRGILYVKYPVEYGIVCNWDDMETLLEYTFSSQLRVDPKEINVFVTEPALVPKANREKITQIMFEKFGVVGFFLQSTAPLTLFAAGRSTGVAVESGQSTYISVVYEGHTLPHTIPKTLYGGSDLDWYLQKLINSRGYQFKTHADTEIAKKMKELLCFVSEDYETDLKISETSDKFHKEYELPDGRKICLNSERFMVGEGLLQPDIYNNEFPGIHEQIKRAITRADSDLRPVLCQNIVLSGGNTMFPGFKERLEKELNTIMYEPASQGVKVIGQPERKLGPWIGGSIMASMSDMEKKWITAVDYEENGPAQVHIRCF